jgi:hypothetical protein
VPELRRSARLFRIKGSRRFGQGALAKMVDRKTIATFALSWASDLLFVSAHEAAVANHIGRQDGCEPSPYTLGGQGTPPLQGGTHDSTGAGGRLGGVRVPSTSLASRKPAPARWKRFD